MCKSSPQPRQPLTLGAIVLLPQGFFVEDSGISADEFVIRLDTERELVFRRVNPGQPHFAAREVQRAGSQGPDQRASAQGVWWSRRAALAAGVAA